MAYPYLSTMPSDAALRSLLRPSEETYVQGSAGLGSMYGPKPVNFLQHYPSDAAGRTVLSRPVVKTRKTPATVVTKTTPAAPAQTLSDYLASLVGPAPDQAAMQATATKQAQDAIAAMIAPWVAQQQKAREAAQWASEQIGRASEAVSQSLVPLGDQSASDYKDALDQLRQFGQGYQGQTQADANAVADANQAMFDKLGMPATATNLGGDLGNVLYGLGAAIPASPLAASGVASTTAARALPSQVMANAVQAEQQALATGFTNVGALQQNIDQANAQLPTLVQQYLTQATDQYQTKLKNTLDLLSAQKPIPIGSAATGYKLVNPWTGQVISTIKPATPTTGAAASPWRVTVDKVGNNLVTTKYNQVTGVTQRTTMAVDPGDMLIKTQRGGMLVGRITDGKLVVTDQITGDPLPWKTATFPNGTFAIGTDKDGKPFKIKLGDAKAVPPIIRSYKGGVGVFNGTTGLLITSYAGNPKTAKPPTTVKAGGWTYYPELQPDGTWKYKNTGLPRDKQTGDSAGTPSFSDIASVQDRISEATKYSPPKWVTGHEGSTDPKWLTDVGHIPEPYLKVLNDAINANPKPTKAWIQRVTAMVNNSYVPVAAGLAQQLHLDPSQKPLGLDPSKYKPETLQQVLPGLIYMNLLNGGFPEGMARAAVLNEFGISSGQLAIRIEAADALARTGQVKKPPKGKGGKSWWNSAGNLLHPLFPPGGGWLPFASTATASAATNVSYKIPERFGTGPYQNAAVTAAQQAGIDPAVFVAQINQESGFDPGARSGAGAQGIAQIVPGYHPDAPPASDPMGQLAWAAHYMAKLVNKYGSYEKALSVYNSGKPNAYLNSKFAKGQTYNYVNSIMSAAGQRQGGTQLVSFTGPTQGIDPTFMQKVYAAAAAVGATQVIITSGKRSNNANPGGPTNTGVPNSNHLYGHAIDGYAVINGKKVLLGQALLPVVDRFGLRSGDVPGFYQGKPDPEHVDDGYNVGLVNV